MELLAKIVRGEGAAAEMPQELARELFENGGVLVLKDFPEGCEFGVDCRSWAVGPKFLGLKMIPPGIHFIYLSVPNAPRIAFFHDFKPREVLLRKWNKLEEDLATEGTSDEELDRIRSNLKTIDPSLGAYPYADYQQWTSLSSYITSKTLARLSPLNALGRISAQVELNTLESEMERRLGDPNGLSIVDRQRPARRVRFTDESGLPVMVESGEGEKSRIRFSPVPQITLADTNLKWAGIDSSPRLLELLERVGEDHRELMGEFQYAYVVFLIGQLFEGFDQWKRLLHLFCSCTTALKTHRPLFNELLMVLHFQLRMVPDDFFEEDLLMAGGSNFIQTTLALMFMNMEDHLPAGDQLRTRATKFRLLLESKFKGRSFGIPDDD